MGWFLPKLGFELKKIKDMGKIIKITESQLKKIVENVIKEYGDDKRLPKLAIKYNKKNLINDGVNQAMDELNTLLSGYGVEAVTGEEYKKGYWANILFLYVNMGEAYVNTIIYDTEKEEFIASSWGDYYEENYADMEDGEEFEDEEDSDWEREHREDYDYQSGAPTPYD